MIGVVDASALVRLFVPDGAVPDGFREFLRGVERGLNRAIAPELLVAETANVMDKKRKAGELSDQESERLLADLLAVPIRFFAHRLLIGRAFELSKEYHLTVYDTLYLSLAEEHGAVLFSADEAMLKAARRLGLL